MPDRPPKTTAIIVVQRDAKTDVHLDVSWAGIKPHPDRSEDRR